VNEVGIYYAYWTHEWDVDFHPYVDKAADIGFDVLELNGGTVATLSPDERRRLRAHADDRGLSLSYVVGLPAEYDVAAEDGATRRRGVEFLKRMIGAIGEMGGGRLGGIIYGAWPGRLPPDRQDPEPFVERSLDSMREAAATAADHDVFLNLEVVNRFEQYIFNTCREALTYLDRLGSDRVNLLLDSFHLNIEEDFVADAIVEAGPRLGHFHIGENNRLPPGYGHMPWTEIAAALRRIGYEGYVVMEPFVRPGGRVGRDIGVYRDRMPGADLDEEARKALLFMRGVLK
jgi:D-psicose/D-tagatose/L-ribulose 3-epimerase